MPPDLPACTTVRLFLILPCLYLLALSGCRRGEGALYREQLSEAIRTSDAIHITEHSNPFDFRDESAVVPADAPTRIYQEMTLPPEAVEIFHQEIRGMEPEPPEYPSGCLFVDHHTIRFIKNGATTSTIKICFKCSRIQWDGTTRVPPENLIRHIKRVLTWNGFKPEQDWERLAIDVPPLRGKLYGPLPGQ